MAFFDELGKKISVTGQNVMQKAKGMADITSLKSQINEEQKKIDKYCQSLGHYSPKPQAPSMVIVESSPVTRSTVNITPALLENTII